MKDARIWAFGLLAAFISGGSSGVVGGITASVLDPEHFSFRNHLLITLQLTAVVFLVSGITGACAYLNKSPLPRTVWTPQERARRLGRPYSAPAPVEVLKREDKPQHAPSTPQPDEVAMSRQTSA